MKALTSVKNVRSKANAFTQKKGDKEARTSESRPPPPLTLTLKEGGGAEGKDDGEEEEHKNGEADAKPATFQEAFGNIFKPKEKKRKMTTAELARVSQVWRRLARKYPYLTTTNNQRINIACIQHLQHSN